MVLQISTHERHQNVKSRACIVLHFRVKIALVYSKPFTTKSRLLTTTRKTAFEYIVEKGKNTGNLHFSSLFLHDFYPIINKYCDSRSLQFLV